MLDQMLYSLAKPVLFALNPEQAHDVTLHNLARVSRSPFLNTQVARWYADRIKPLPTQCMGLEFRHPVGLAAGLDKEAAAFNALSALGFSAVEMGTVTPKPQPGNEKPRLFRLVEDKALINRMGFNSGGLDAFLQNAQTIDDASRARAVVGINVGKNAVTDMADAHYDYATALQRVYAKADYVTVNISSPNTKSLRELQNANYLDDFLSHLKRVREKCEQVHERTVPLALKVAPDLSADDIETISELVLSHRFDAVIATNTTIERPTDLKSSHASEAGGLSGQPLTERSTQVIAEFYQHLKGQVSIIGVGGISTAQDAWDKLVAGADFLQVYSMFIYQGPLLVREIVSGLHQRVAQAGVSSLGEAVDLARAR